MLCERLTRSMDPKFSHFMYDDKYNIELACTKEKILTLEPMKAEIRAAVGANVLIVPMDSAMNLVA